MKRKRVSKGETIRLARALDSSLADLFLETASSDGQYTLTVRERRLVDAFRDADDHARRVAMAALGAEPLRLQIDGPQVFFSTGSRARTVDEAEVARLYREAEITQVHPPARPATTRAGSASGSTPPQAARADVARARKHRGGGG